jgi:hypothetical protein
MAQNGPDNMVALPIKAIDGNTIQLGSGYGKTYTFTLDAKTVYCQGVNKALDWTYLREKIGKEATVTVKLARTTRGPSSSGTKRLQSSSP